MKAIKYRIKITTDAIHGWQQDVDEIFIPDEKIIINSLGGCFESDSSRADKNTEVENVIILDKDVETFKKYIEYEIKAMEGVSDAFGIGDGIIR